MNNDKAWQGYEQRGEAERNRRITMDEARKMMSEVLQTESDRNLRDWFAGICDLSEDIKWIREADDQELLERYGTEEEIEKGFEFSIPLQPVKLHNIFLRHCLEARARSEMRFIEADAMLKARTK